MSEIPTEFRPDPQSQRQFPELRPPAGRDSNLQINGLEIQVRWGNNSVAKQLASRQGDDLEAYKRFLWNAGVRSRCPDAHGYLLVYDEGVVARVVVNGYDKGWKYVLGADAEEYVAPADVADKGWYIYDPWMLWDDRSDSPAIVPEDRDGTCLEIGYGPGWYEVQRWIPPEQREPAERVSVLCYLASRPLPVGGVNVVKSGIELPYLLVEWAKRYGFNGEKRSSTKLYVVQADRGPIRNGPPRCTCVLYGHAAAHALEVLNG